MTEASDVFADVLKGAGTGAAFGPIGAGAGAAVGLAMGLLPGVAHLLTGDDDTMAKVAQTVQAVTGTADPVQQQASAADPHVAADLRTQLAQIAADREAENDRAAEARLAAMLADTDKARQQTATLAQAGSHMAWGSAVVSTVLLVAWFSTMLANYFHATPLGADDAATLRNLAVGVAGFWLGSSIGSNKKDALLQQSVPRDMLPQPAKIEAAN